MKPVELTSEDIRIGRYKSIFEDEQTYYVSSLNELGEQVPNELYQKLFPNVAYIRWRVFENGKGLAYRYPLFLKRRINNKEFIAKVKAAADTVVLDTHSTENEIKRLDRQLDDQVFYLKEQVHYLKKILGPWIIEWITHVLDMIQDVEELKLEFREIADTVNSVWINMQSGYDEEGFRSYLAGKKLPGLDSNLTESVCRGYKHYLSMIEKSLLASERLYLSRLKFDYALNYGDVESEPVKEEHGNTKISDEEIIDFLYQNQAFLKAHTSRFIHKGKRWKGQPNISQLADFMLDKYVELDKRTLQGRLGNMKEQIRALMK